MTKIEIKINCPHFWFRIEYFYETLAACRADKNNIIHHSQGWLSSTEDGQKAMFAYFAMKETIGSAINTFWPKPICTEAFFALYKRAVIGIADGTIQEERELFSQFLEEDFRKNEFLFLGFLGTCFSIFPLETAQKIEEDFYGITNRKSKKGGFFIGTL